MRCCSGDAGCRMGISVQHRLVEFGWAMPVMKSSSAIELRCNIHELLRAGVALLIQNVGVVVEHHLSGIRNAIGMSSPTKFAPSSRRTKVFIEDEAFDIVDDSRRAHNGDITCFSVAW